MSEEPNSNLFTILYNLLDLKLPQTWNIDYEEEDDPQCRFIILGREHLFYTPLLAKICTDPEKHTLFYHFFEANEEQKKIILEILQSKLISIPLREVFN